MSSASRLAGGMALALLLALAPTLVSHAQDEAPATGGGFGLSEDDDKPIEISAENGIEWKRDARTYTARGNALALQGDTSIAADTLIAYLDANDELSSWEAFGNVKIETGESTSYGDHAKYEEASRMLLLTGNNLKVVTENQTVTARDQIEYWRDKDVVVAKGNVVIVRPEKNTTIHADEATGYFRDKVDDPATAEVESGSEVYQLEAHGHVKVEREERTATANHLAYDPKSDIAVLTGNVVIHSKDNVYSGGRAELDMGRDVSRLLPAEGQRVRTVIKTKKKNETTEGAPVTQ